MPRRVLLVEFPADDPDRARLFWSGLLGSEFTERRDDEGQGWQTREPGVAIGVHERGRGPGDAASLPYVEVSDLGTALEQVVALGGSIVHPGSRWAICRDSEDSPFGLVRRDVIVDPAGTPPITPEMGASP